MGAFKSTLPGMLYGLPGIFSHTPLSFSWALRNNVWSDGRRDSVSGYSYSDLGIGRRRSIDGYCCADVLAGKSARNDVNTSAPRISVKGSNVIPNREGRKKAVVLSGGKNACCVGIPLNGANGSPSKQLSSEYSSTSAREKSQLIHDSPYQFHTLFRRAIFLSCDQRLMRRCLSALA